MKRRCSTVLAIGGLCLFSCFTSMPALAVETTLYVGKHFEVRDHDQPTKYVFNGDTRIARITGSLSTNTRIQRFRLRSGWNLLSLAVSVTNLSEQLQRPGVVALARSWNAQTGTYSPVPQVAPSGTVLWVNATTNTTLGVVGTYADPVHRQIAAGATYLASTGLEAWSPTLPPSVAAWSFDSQPPVRRSFSGGGSSFNFPPTWHARLTGDLSSINDLPKTFPPGQALYVINHAPFELEIPDPALRIRYYHQDHLGSSSVMTDADGVLVEETAFYPFGIPRHEHRLRSVEEHYKFTQKERDRESGLFYFEARYLTAGLARFAVPDLKYAHPNTLVEADAAEFFSNPQKLNLYAYARNSPLNHVDPTGLDEKTPTALERAQKFIEDLEQAGVPDGYTGPSVWDNIETMVDRGREISLRPYDFPLHTPVRLVDPSCCKKEYQAYLDAFAESRDPKNPKFDNWKNVEICNQAKELEKSNCALARLKHSTKTANTICTEEKIRADKSCKVSEKSLDLAGKALDECNVRNNCTKPVRNSFE